MQKRWWKESVVYQIYPRSFKDSNGDGVGDLRGIIEKLDYLQKLGIDVVWLCPVYKSPNDDNGYDISDYYTISEQFGTLSDWEELLSGLHDRGIRLIMDLVVNHTSDEHPWFVQSRQSKDNPYRDYYVWRSGKAGHEPNNWTSMFGGSAWQYDEATDEYYLHLFSPKQPDLNWENPQVRAEIYKMMHWWLQKGIDGFRMDAINLISKVPGLPDAPIKTDDRAAQRLTNSGKADRYQFGGQYFINGPRLQEFLSEMKREVLSRYDILTVGETPMLTTEHGIALTHEETGSLNMLFQFEHMMIDEDPNSALTRRSLWNWRLGDLKRVITRWQKELEGKGWNSQYLVNHDTPRGVSRFGNDGQYRVESAKLLATFLLMLHGTPYVYQGEEIGMTNVQFESIEDYNDIETRNIYRELVEEKGIAPAAAMEVIHAKSRDNSRTPMQWDDSPQAGFTTGTPWIGINPNYREINVRQAIADPNSIFAYYQKLIQLRRTVPAIVYGTYDLILEDHEQIYAFTRTLETDRLLIVLNFSQDQPVFTLPSEISFNQQERLIGNYDVGVNVEENAEEKNAEEKAEAIEDLRQIRLRPYEARVYRLSG